MGSKHTKKIIRSNLFVVFDPSCPSWLSFRELAVGRWELLKPAFAHRIKVAIFCGKMSPEPFARCHSEESSDLPVFFGPAITGEQFEVRGPGFSDHYEGESAAVASIL
jgi:hypothetical protein